MVELFAASGMVERQHRQHQGVTVALRLQDRPSRNFGSFLRHPACGHFARPIFG